MGQNKFLLVIKADYNDADYAYTRLEWTEGEQYTPDIELLKKVAKALKNNHGRWGNGQRRQDYNPREMYEGILTEEEIDQFDDLTPYNEYGIHSIENITLYKIEDKTKIY